VDKDEFDTDSKSREKPGQVDDEDFDPDVQPWKKGGNRGQPFDPDDDDGE
jgi:hypothetical protein